MKLILQPEPCEPPFDFSNENVGQQAINALIASLDVFHSTPIRVGQDAVYFYYAGQVFELQIDMKVVRRLGMFEDVPVDFVQPVTLMKPKKVSWWRRLFGKD